MGLNFENWSKFWKRVQILKTGSNFEKGSKFWKRLKILKTGQNFENLPKIGPANLRVIYIWRMREMRVDTRSLPEAKFESPILP